MHAWKLILCVIALLCPQLVWAHDNQQQRSITLYVTVDWEGWSLDEENLDAMRQFRRKHPEIPMLHLLNPVYFVRSDINAADAAQKIQSTLLPGDAHGLHLHGWKSLVERCELPYRSEPSFGGVNEECVAGDCGYTVSLEYAYSEHELTILVGCSVDLMVQHGFEWPKRFRSGGWQFGPKLANAILKNGFVMDSSRTAPLLVAKRWDESSNLVKMVRSLHADGSILDQPFELLPGLMELPNNASLADYTRTEELVEIFRTLIANNKNVMVLGFHQESAFNYLDRLADAIPLMQEIANQAGVRL
ncbi:MAG TPA: hypothetical protein VEA39_00800, partial [Methylophilaceae bacterium]|nr:hypothetical protein [Methylophilaceae bacterium]